MIVYTTCFYNKKKIGNKKIVNEIFEIFEQVGEGSYWKVFKVKRNLKNQDENFYVFKEGKLSIKDYDEMNEFDFQEDAKELRVGMKEYNLLKNINHKNIARLYECIIDNDLDKIVFVMEYCDMQTLMFINESGDGYKYNLDLIKYTYHYITNETVELDNINFSKDNKVLVTIAKFLLKHISEALKYLHDKNISHRDIKPDNVLFKTEDNNFKLIDFSISKQLYSKDEYILSMQGTDPLKPPEVIECLNHDPFKVDIYNLGATIYIFLCNSFDYNFSILKETYPSLYDLISQMMNIDVSLRPNIEEILSSEFLNTL